MRPEDPICPLVKPLGLEALRNSVRSTKCIKGYYHPPFLSSASFVPSHNDQSTSHKLRRIYSESNQTQMYQSHHQLTPQTSHQLPHNQIVHTLRSVHEYSSFPTNCPESRDLPGNKRCSKKQKSCEKVPTSVCLDCTNNLNDSVKNPYFHDLISFLTVYLFANSPRPGDSEVTFAVFELS